MIAEVLAQEDGIYRDGCCTFLLVLLQHFEDLVALDRLLPPVLLHFIIIIPIGSNFFEFSSTTPFSDSKY